MKKSVKKILCLFICAVLVVTPWLNAAAQSKEMPEAVRTCPLVTIRGFMSATILADADNPDSEQLWPPSTGTIVKTVVKCLPGLFGFLFFHCDSLLCRELAKNALPILTSLSLDSDGSVSDNSGVYLSLPSADSVTPESKYDYFYDWRLDPIEEAAKLNDFINYIADCSGCGQVVIQCYSYGSTIAAAYAAIYGTEKVKTFVYNSAALFGVTSVGEVLEGKAVFEPDSLASYLECFTDKTDFETPVKILLKVLGFTGGLRRLSKLGNKLIENCGDEIISVFAGWPSFWAMVPDKELSAAREHVFGTVFNDGADRSGLINKTENYEKTVKANREKILRSIDENCNFYVVSRYGYCTIFLTPSNILNGDAVIETASTSFGAVTADFGKTLPEEYISAADSKFISPDGIVDASSCLFPDQTWFVRDVTHVGSLGDFNRMIDIMLVSDSQLTVDSYQEFPRFS